MQEIGGTEGEMKHQKIVREIFSQMISDGFAATMSWTGKTNVKGVRKLKFKAYKQTVKIILDLCVAASSASRMECQDILINKALKYAYRGNLESEPSSSSSSPLPDSSVPMSTSPSLPMGTSSSLHSSTPPLDPNTLNGSHQPQNQNYASQQQYIGAPPSNMTLPTMHNQYYQHQYQLPIQTPVPVASFHPFQSNQR